MTGSAEPVGSPRPKALVTGANGFIGRNLVVALRRRGVEVAGVDIDSSDSQLLDGVAGSSVVFHLAGVNRPEREEEFETGNVGSLRTLLGTIDAVAEKDPSGRRPAVVLSSSTQAAQENPYGRSKLAAERLLEAYAACTGTAAVIYRLPGVFGKWCRPDYNSVVATFCYRIARGLPISISDPAKVIELVHVDDVVAAFLRHLDGVPDGLSRERVQPVFSITLAELAGRIRSFRASRETLEMPDTSDPLTRRLLGTYTSYLPPSDLPYALARRDDARGVLAEVFKSPQFGQVFISRTRPGVTRGNHYHDLKVEKFCVLEGEALIRFRPILGGEVIEHRVAGADFKVVDIPPGMTHSIQNVGGGEMVVLFWASEILDRDCPDTYPEEVLRD